MTKIIATQEDLNSIENATKGDSRASKPTNIVRIIDGGSSISFQATSAVTSTISCTAKVRFPDYETGAPMYETRTLTISNGGTISNRWYPSTHGEMYESEFISISPTEDANYYYAKGY